MRAIILKSRPKISIRRRCKPVKNLILIFAILAFAPRSPAQTNEPVRLALVSESGETSLAADVLTAELSKNQKIQLLERNEIEKVYREQGLSTGNKDYLKLGQVLGTDGLLILDVVRTAQATNLTARLIAVKPGVVLTDGNFPWPLKDASQWSESVAVYLNTFLPKLSLSAKDAIPISVVNLRSAVSSDEGVETERQLKLLTIQRLSREPQLFVLERQKMQLLSEEKELKSDDSAFWNGSYLLEGIVDQNGYSKETVTINARLTPSKGGVPLLLEVGGSRTNLAEVINQLAAKIIGALKINSTVKEWNAADEAAQYLDEAKWALRWGIFSEAQAAAESAWALGKRDLDSATTRIRAYLDEIPMVAAPNVGYYKNGKAANYVNINELPDPKYCDVAIYALKCYYEFSRISPDGEPKIKDWNNRHQADWYYLGIADLVAASGVLQHFNYLPESQEPVAEKLAELRALARSVAGLISKSPSIYDSYFVGDRMATHDELGDTIGESPNIFRCQLDWGCFWQEKPEDSIALYRNLMTSPVFSYIHNDLWFRDPETPRLVAWNPADRMRVPMLWQNFVQELGDSTNVLLALEAQALRVADAQGDTRLAVSFTNLFDAIFEHRDELVGNNVEVLYLDWGTGDLVEKMGGKYDSAGKDSLTQLYHSEYQPKLEAMDREYWSKTVPALKTLASFEKQKQFLKTNQVFNFIKLMDVFQEKNYSPSQAHEILPLIVSYKSNLVAQAGNASWRQKSDMDTAIFWVNNLQQSVNQVLNPSAPPSLSHVRVSSSPPVAKLGEAAAVTAPEAVTNVILVNKFLTIPLDDIIQDNGFKNIVDSDISITAHHWQEGKLLLDFNYGVADKWYGSVAGPGIAILDPVTEQWKIVSCPKSDAILQNNFYHQSILLHDELFHCEGGQIEKYDFPARQWQTLPVSDSNNYELFAVNGRMYAANQQVIFEIVDGGKSTRILASNRRQPPASALDTEDLGTPTLFEGPGHSLRVSTKSKIFTWTNGDWREDSAVPPASFPPEIFTDGVMFRQMADGFSQPMSLSGLETYSNAAQLYLRQAAPHPNNVSYRQSFGDMPQFPKPSWKMPPDMFLANLVAAMDGSNLYLLAGHAEIQDVVVNHVIVQKKVVARDGYDASLICFDHDAPLPHKLFLKFDAGDGCPPVTGVNPNSPQWFPRIPPAWMYFSSNFVFFGLEQPPNSFPNGSENTGIGYKAGVWMMPVTQLDAAIAGQRRLELRQAAQASAAAKQLQQTFLVKYDHNHNGLIDPEEKEEALDDPRFIKSELAKIDANQNGWLDAGELIYFDANQNRLLEPKEQAGIEIAQHQLAVQFLRKFDANGDGWLDRPEFDDLLQAGFGIHPRPGSFLTTPFPDENHDGKIDLGELESFLKLQTRRGLRARETPGAAFSQMLNTDQTLDPQHIFKVVVEYYWQHSGAATTSPQGK
jgi:Ca2+-binding EF-hand superfamily protein/TolB-like protein